MASDLQPLDGAYKDPVTKVTPGNLYANKEHGQLRYSVDPTQPMKWVQPLPVHKAGTQIKRGQPVSIGFTDEFTGDYVKVSGEPAIVPSNPRRHQISSGIALNPGAPSINQTVESANVHILTHGQITYSKKDERFWKTLVGNDSTEYYMPPHGVIDVQARDFDFEWSYEDIGKPVYVDSRIGHKGELTIRVEDAYADGGNICSIGRLADAPRKTGTAPNIHDNANDHNVVIDVQITGDSRGLIDSTQFDVLIEDTPDRGLTRVVNPGPQDKIVMVKSYFSGGVTRGMMIRDDTDLSRESDGSPVGAFIAKPGVDYYGKTIVVHRLGIVEGDFGYSTSDVGRELSLSNGSVSTTGSSTSYEYKMGVVIDTDRVLIDCRFIRHFKKYAPVGEMKPVYSVGNPPQPIKKYVEPGYLVIDPQMKKSTPDFDQYVRDQGAGASATSKSKYYNLVSVIMYREMVDFYLPNGSKIDIYSTATPSGNQPWTADDLVAANAYFEFRDVYYTVDGNKMMTQIKYVTEGSPDNMEVLWPYKVFNVTLTGDTYGSYLNGVNSTVRLNITDLVNIGGSIAKDDTTYLLDDFEISMIIGNQYAPDGGQHAYFKGGALMLSPGFYTKSVVETYTVQYWSQPYDPGHQPPQWDNDISHFEKDGMGTPKPFQKTTAELKICGYEWRISNQQASFGSNYYLDLITNPGNSDVMTAPDYVPPHNVLGICWPAGVPLKGDGYNNTLYATIIVRRRPTEYNELLLNQLYSSSTWNTDLWSDGNGTIGLQRLAFGSDFKKAGQPADWRYAHEFAMLSGGDLNTSADSQSGGYQSSQGVKVQEVHYFGDTIPSPAGLTGVPEVIDQIYMAKNGTSMGWVPIRLTFDLKKQAISSNAFMAFKYYSPDTAAPYIGSDKRFYYDPAETTHGPRGRIALQSIYETPVGLFEYLDATSAQRREGLRISPFKDLFGYAFQRANNKNIDFHRYELVENVARYIWKIDDLEHSDPLGTIHGTQYFYSTPEIKSINEDILSTYGSEKKDQSIQSTIGLLTQGVSETQERLLKLERATFGADLETIPGGLSPDQISIRTKYKDIVKSLTNFGALRLTRFLVDSQIVLTKDDTGTLDTEFWTFWQNVLNEVMGWRAKDPATPSEPFYGVFHTWKFVPGDVPPFTESKTQSSLLPSRGDPRSFETGNVSDIWFWIKFILQDWDSAKGAISNYSSEQIGAPDYMGSSFPNTAILRSDHIFFKRGVSANERAEDKAYWLTEDKVQTSYVPIPAFPNKKNLSILHGSKCGRLVDFFLNSESIGKSDGVKADVDEMIPDVKETFPSQSLEGLISDYQIRLIAIRSLFDKTFGTLRSSITMFSITESSNTSGNATTYITAAPNVVNLFVGEPVLSYNANDYLNWKTNVGSFSSAFGFDKFGKIQVPGALILKGLVPGDVTQGNVDEYVSSNRLSVDYDKINIIDGDRSALEKDTHIPLKGMVGNNVIPKTHDYVRGAVSLDTDYLAEKVQDDRVRPSTYKVNDKANHPNVDRYTAEIVLDVPRGRKYSSGSFRDSNSPDRASVDLKLKPEYSNKRFDVHPRGPYRRATEKDKDPTKTYSYVEYEPLTEELPAEYPKYEEVTDTNKDKYWWAFENEDVSTGKVLATTFTLNNSEHETPVCEVVSEDTETPAPLPVVTNITKTTKTAVVTNIVKSPVDAAVINITKTTEEATVSGSISTTLKSGSILTLKAGTKIRFKGLREEASGNVVADPNSSMELEVDDPFNVELAADTSVDTDISSLKVEYEHIVNPGDIEVQYDSIVGNGDLEIEYETIENPSDITLDYDQNDGYSSIGVVHYDRATETVARTDPQQEQSVSILKDELQFHQIIDITYPQTTRTDLGLVIREGTDRPSGQLKDSNVLFDIPVGAPSVSLPNGTTTIEEAFEMLVLALGGANHATIKGLKVEAEGVRDDYLDKEFVIDYEDFRRRINTIVGGMVTSNNAADVLARTWALKVQKMWNDMISNNWTHTYTPLEMHAHAVLDGQSMPEMAFWVDIKNTEIYLKFKKHISKIMTLAVKLQDYKWEISNGRKALAKQDKEWPWEDKVSGLAREYPLTVNDTNVLFPDIINNGDTWLWYTLEEVAIRIGVEILLPTWYGLTVSQASGRGLPTLLASDTYLDSVRGQSLEANTVLKPGMKFWRVNWESIWQVGSGLTPGQLAALI